MDELIKSEDAGFFEVIHAIANFEVDIAVDGDRNVVMVIIPELLQNDGGSDAYILEVYHGCAEVEIFDNEAKVVGAVFGIGNVAVDV